MLPKKRLHIRLAWWFHIWLYRLSGGLLGTRLLDMPVLLLVTRGAKSGKNYVHALSYLYVEENFAVAASNGGASVHPGWHYNLLAHPNVQLQVGRKKLHARAREATGSEHGQLWARFKEMESAYARYEQRTSRKIPVFVLEPKLEK
jgi:deazaflavin-dependent oxidoreductase (nitroreductase family)